MLLPFHEVTQQSRNPFLGNSFVSLFAPLAENCFGKVPRKIRNERQSVPCEAGGTDGSDRGVGSEKEKQESWSDPQLIFEIKVFDVFAVCFSLCKRRISDDTQACIAGALVYKAEEPS